MRGYVAEFLGTFFLVFTFLGAAASVAPLAAVSVSAILVATVWADLLSYWAAQLLGALVVELLFTFALVNVVLSIGASTDRRATSSTDRPWDSWFWLGR